MTGPDKSAFLQEMEDTIERDYPWTMNISKSILRISVRDLNCILIVNKLMF